MEFFGHHLCPDFPTVPSDLSDAATYDGTIIIIGAGVAGLTAAASLLRMGLPKEKVVVLEASDRVGGRLKATPPDSFDGPPLDLGAEWIHSTKGAKVLESIMQDLAGEEDGDDREKVVPELIPYTPEMYLNGKKSRIFSWMYKETKFRNTTWYHWLVSNLYDRVKDCVVFDSPVTKVKYGDGGEKNDTGESGAVVTLTFENGATRAADRLICTAPLAVLRERAIEFDPPLPERMNVAIDAIDMAPGVRVLFRMERKFYRDLYYCGSLLDLIKNGDDLAIIYDPLLGKGPDGKGTHVCAFVAVGNKNAGDLCKLSEDELAKTVLARIDKAYNGQGTKNLVGTPIVQNWRAEPYIRGAYTFSDASSKLRKDLGKPVGKSTVFFAGEHTSVKHPSLVPGAACEGRKAALDVVSSLNLGGETNTSS
mmetsp:Transcript_30225/g.69286  ORF Transcript_30225/g.69286 Transcript_30225/m.69286 type:complete len:422 (-) Transcript_30225:197-1462(-)